MASARGGETIRVLSVPAGHVYVQHLEHPSVSDLVRRLPDPRVSSDVPTSQWWPPPALDAQWVLEHHMDFDLYHVHFGFDARSAADLSALVDALRRYGKPLVYTVHDLRNPHHHERGLHDAALDVLVPAADALITLTPGAAAEVARRWGLSAYVLPHPHVVEEPTLSRPRPVRDGFTVGIHLKSLRASMDPIPVVTALARTVRQLPEARLRVDVHTDVVSEGNRNYDPDVARLLERGHREGLFALSVHDCYSDDELWDYFQELDVSVLPYRFGTHSGWLEACYDLGTTVLAADCGFFDEQRPCFTYHLDEAGLDEASLATAVHRAYEERPSWRADPRRRRHERVELATAHRAIYERLMR